METYRIVCRFEPGHKRLAGQIAGTKTRKTQRGAWRVLDAYVCPPQYEAATVREPARTQLFASGLALRIAAARPQRIGTLCDPFKLLKEWQAARRAGA